MTEAEGPTVTLMTGGTGYLGSYAVDTMLRHHPDARLVLLVRGRSQEEATDKLWKALQLHRDARSFREDALPRIELVLGDVTAPSLGLDLATVDRLARSVDGVLHIAASLNRKSERACMNVNLRGTLGVLRLTRELRRARGALRRFTFVSTNAVAGERDREHVQEDEAIDWNRRQYDPYARTKAFGEHMVRELLPDVPFVICRPSIVLGDRRHPRTTQFDMVRAMSWLADLPVLPVRPEARVDIVNADWVGRALAELHLAPSLDHDCYHLTAGSTAPTVRELAESVSGALGRRPAPFAPALDAGFEAAIDGMNALPGRSALTYVGSLLKVFWPYVTYDTVFDHRRAVAALGEAPARFPDYGGPFVRWCREQGFRYPYQERWR
jgi:thioester reductase-like protein